MLPILKRRELERVDYLPSIGEYSTGEPLTVDPYDLKHWLISGATGGGKSSYINSLLNVLQHYDYQFFGVDCKHGLELQPWSRLFTKTATNITEASEVIDLVQKEMGNRLQHLQTKQLRKWPYQDRIILVVDELSEALTIDYSLSDKKGKQEAKQRLDGLITIARIGRAAGISLICATQHPLAHVISSDLKNNLTVRIVCKVASQEAFRTSLGDSYGLDHEAIPPYPGCAYILGLPHSQHGPRLGKAYWSDC